MNYGFSIFICASISAAGCTSIESRRDFSAVAKQVQDRTGARSVWNQGTAADMQTQQAVHELLAGDLTADSAVQVALLNNPNIQATYEDLGIAQAELVQAGLLSNPIFAALLRFPDGGHGNPDLEISVSQNFIELLSLPLRKKVAAAQYEAAKARIAGNVVGLAADVREAFFTFQGAQQMIEMHQATADATAASTEAAQRLRDAGNNTELDLANELAGHAQAELDLSRAKADAARAREKLVVLLGGASHIRVGGRLPELPRADPDSDHLETFALHQRLDFAAAVANLNLTYASLGLAQRFTWLNDAELTADTEHDVDGSWVTGPGISVPIPIFDTGAAQTSIAAGRVRQARQRMVALAIQIRSDTRVACMEMQATRERAENYHNVILPLRQKITRQTQLQFNGMLTSVYQLLDAKRYQIDAGRGYVEALRDYWVARVQLERAVGGRLPGMQ